MAMGHGVTAGLGVFAMGLAGSCSVCYRFIINVLYTKLQNPPLAFGMREVGVVIVVIA
jgi:hypothetical protein